MKKLLLFIAFFICVLVSNAQVNGYTVHGKIYVQTDSMLIIGTDTIRYYYDQNNDTIVSKWYVDSLYATLAGGHSPVTLNSSATTGGLSLSDQEISFQAATNSVNGYLTSTNFNTFNNKLSYVEIDNLLSGFGTPASPLSIDTLNYIASKDWVTRYLLISDFTWTNLSGKPTIPTVSNVAYDATWDGNLDATTKNTIYDLVQSLGGGHDAVTLTTTAQTGGLSLNVQELNMQQATTTQNGWLSSTDWNAFDAKLDWADTLTYLGTNYRIDTLASGIYGYGFLTSETPQTLSIDSTGATAPREFMISISDGNTIKFLDLGGGGAGEIAWSDTTDLIATKYDIDTLSFLRSYSETDPIFTGHTVYNISNGTGFLKNNGSGTWSYDNSTYLTSADLSDYYNKTTDNSDDITEGSTNLFDQVVSFVGGTNVTIGGTYPNFTITDNSGTSDYSTTDFNTDFGTKTTDDLTEGSTNFYSKWTNDANGIEYTAGNVGIGMASDGTYDLSVGSTSYFGDNIWMGTSKGVWFNVSSWITYASYTSLEAGSSATPDAGYGTWWAGTDGHPHYTNDGGTSFDLALGGGIAWTDTTNLIATKYDIDTLSFLRTESQTLSIDSTGAAAPRTFTVSISGGNSIGFNDTGGGGSVTSVAAGNGMDFATINTSGSVTMGTPSTITLSSINEVTSTSHTHALDLTGLTITESQITDLDHFTNADETDPIFTAHTVYNISDGTGFLKNNGTGTWSYDNNTYLTSADLNGYVQFSDTLTKIGTNYRIDTLASGVYGYGFLTDYTETDPVYIASSWYTTTNNSTNWDAAYTHSQNDNDISATNEIQTISIDSSGASYPRTFTISLSDGGGSVKFLDLGGTGGGDIAWTDTTSTIATKYDIDTLSANIRDSLADHWAYMVALSTGSGFIEWTDTVSTIATQTYVNDLIGDIETSTDIVRYAGSVGTGIEPLYDVFNGTLRAKTFYSYDGSLIIADSTDMVNLMVDSSKYATQYDLTQVSGGSVSFGSQYQIPIVNSTTDDFDYADLSFNGSTDLMTIGDATGSPEIRLNKDETGVATISFYKEGVSNSSLYSDINENIYVNGGSGGYLSVGGTSHFNWNSSKFSSINTYGGALVRSGSSYTVPYVFEAGDSNSGIGSNNADGVAIISNAKTSLLSTNAGTGTNIEIGGSVGSFGGTTAGQGVLRLNDVVTAPTGTLTSGGLLYVSGTAIHFLADDGTDTDLTSGSGATNLSISGSSSAVNINSDTGTDVTLNAGTGVSFSSITGSAFTIDASAGGVTIGTTGQIPIVNATNDDFTYVTNFDYASANLYVPGALNLTNGTNSWVIMDDIDGNPASVATGKGVYYVNNNKPYFMDENETSYDLTSGSSTDLTFSGSSSPVTLQSSTGTDVVFTAGTNVSFAQSGNNLTINASGSGMVYPSGTGFAIVSGGTSWGTTLTDPLGATHGGTGTSTVTTGDLLYGSATNTWSKLSATTSGYILTANGTSTAPSWQIPAWSKNSGYLTLGTSTDEVRIGSATDQGAYDLQVADGAYIMGEILTQEQLMYTVSGTQGTNFTHDSEDGDAGFYRITSTSAWTLSIHNLQAGNMGTIFLNYVTATPLLPTINTYSDGGSTGLTEVVIGATPTPANGKTTSVTYTCGNDGTNTYVYLVYGQQE